MPETTLGFHGGIQLPLYLNANDLFLRTPLLPEPGQPREQLFHFVIKNCSTDILMELKFYFSC